MGRRTSLEDKRRGSSRTDTNASMGASRELKRRCNREIIHNEEPVNAQGQFDNVNKCIERRNNPFDNLLICLVPFSADRLEMPN
jgi:hypothetical protein